MEKEVQEAKKEVRQRNLDNDEIAGKLKESEKEKTYLKAAFDKSESEKAKALESLKKA
jgi:hypothetical protein